MDTMLLQYARQGYLYCIDEWTCYYTDLLPYLSEEKKQLMEKKAEDAVRQYKDIGLRNGVAFMKAMHLSLNENKETHHKISALKKIANDADKRGDTCMKIRAMAEILKIYNTAVSDYPTCFMLAVLLTTELNKTTKEQFPEINSIYYYIGEAYYLFQDYDRAIFFLEKASDSPLPFFMTMQI